jgi:cyclopropane fatty-acyl-phospholipid synthase-like methyltransferase
LLVLYLKILSKNYFRKEIKILELGFGTGANLWFAAREGFSVFGVEGSKTAVSIAKNFSKLKNYQVIFDWRFYQITICKMNFLIL